MRSSRHQDCYPKYNEGQQEDNNSTTVKQKKRNEDQTVEESSSTIPLANDKNKKHVHYRQVSSKGPAINNVKNGSSRQSDNISLGINNNKKSNLEIFYLCDSYFTSENPISSEHVIPTEKESRCSCCCCSRQRSLLERLRNSFSPLRQFIKYQPYFSWIVLVASFLTYSIGEAITSVFPILFVALQEEFPNKGSSRIALIQSMMSAVPCLSGPISSITTTRLGYRKAAMLGGTIGSLSLLATSFARRLEFLYITMGICYALGNSLVLVSTVVAITKHFEAKPSFASGVTISGMLNIFGWQEIFCVFVKNFLFVF